MSEHSDAERTEQATPRRREDAREEGRIPRSQELTVAASLLGSAMVLSAMGPSTGQRLGELMGHSLASAGSVMLDARAATLLLRETAWRAFTATFGLILALVAGSAVIATVQARGVFSLKPLMPQFSRIDPMKNAKNLLGARQLVELLKSIGKLIIVGCAVWVVVRAALPDAVALSQESQLSLAIVVRRYAVRMLTTAGLSYVALAAGDYVWQWWQYEKSIRMTKEELKMELKQNDGDRTSRRAAGASRGRTRVVR